MNGRDELARLAASFNATLEELERSVAAQRHLIADAGHELRTPIASLRANIQVLQDAARLAPEDREALRRDIIDELDELTALVSDVAELARGGRGELAADDVRLDEIVAGAVERTRRRCDLRFEITLQPTVVRGAGERINRAVANLLDNARKWSPRAASSRCSCATVSFPSATTAPASKRPISRTSSSASTERTPPADCRAPDSGWRSCARRPRPITGSRGPRTRRAAAGRSRSASGRGARHPGRRLRA